ncbi:MAG: class I SAM-dependent methyltransferase [Maribacter sp.]
MSVLLKKQIFEGISQQELAQQIESKKKCQKKLPSWFETQKIYYPKKINIEQTSSETTAQYKSKIVDGKSLLDLTGGLGIDSYYFSKKIASISHCEIDENLHKITSHNYKILRVDNIATFNKNGLKYLRNSNQNFDWLYLDPSRRNEVKGKVFKLSDCQPDVLENLELLFSKSENILIKTSPLLDISEGIKSLSGIKEIHTIAIQNDVKELLWILKKGYSGEIAMKTINFTNSDIQKFDFTSTEEQKTHSEYSLPLTFLYEPNAAILKSGAFKILGEKLNLQKLHSSTHLYTSNNLLNFPGRCFKVLALEDYSTKKVKKLNIKKANITTRNFVDSVAQIRKRFKIKEGGKLFLLFFKNNLNKYQLAVCEKASK